MSEWFDRYRKSNGNLEPETNWWRNKSREYLQAELRRMWDQLQQRHPKIQAGGEELRACSGCGSLIANNHRVGCPLGRSAPAGWIACCIEKAREDLGLPLDWLNSMHEEPQPKAEALR